MAGDAEMLTALAWAAVAATIYGAYRISAFFITDAMESIEE